MIPNNIENIIFDLGGVILNIDYLKTINSFKDMGIENFDALFTQAQQSSIFDDFETGKLSETLFIDKLQNHFHIKKENSEIITAWNSMLLDLPKFRKKTLEEYSKRFNIVLLSNTNETHIKAFKRIISDTFDEYWFSEVFKNVYYSNELGMRKPNSDIFEFVLRENNFKAENTLFIDDSIQHIEGANKIGIQTIHLQTEKIEDFL